MTPPDPVVQAAARSDDLRSRMALVQIPMWMPAPTFRSPRPTAGDGGDDYRGRQEAARRGGLKRRNLCGTTKQKWRPKR